MKTHLAQQKATDESQRNLYNHLSEVMSHMVTHCPAEALNKLEEISYLLKNKDTIAIQNFLKLHETHIYAQPAYTSLKSATSDLITASKKHF